MYFDNRENLVVGFIIQEKSGGIYNAPVQEKNVSLPITKKSQIHNISDFCSDIETNMGTLYSFPLIYITSCKIMQKVSDFR